MAVEKEFINPDNIYPAPWKFNQAVKVKQGGTTTVYISGIVGLHPDGSIDKGDIVSQAKNAYSSLHKVIEAAGGQMTDIVKTNTYIAEDFRIHRGEVRDVRDEFFPTDWPVNTLMEVAGMANPDYLFEIEAVAVLDE